MDGNDSMLKDSISHLRQTGYFESRGTGAIRAQSRRLATGRMGGRIRRLNKFPEPRRTQDHRGGMLLRLRHLLADDDSMPGLGIDPRSDWHASARNGVRVFPLGDHAVFDDLRRGRRHLAFHRRGRWRCRRRDRDRLLFSRAANQAHQQNEPQVLHEISSPTITLPSPPNL